MMDEDFVDEEHDAEEELMEEVVDIKGIREVKLKMTERNRAGLRWYGETFKGFQTAKDYNELLPSYKDFYYDAKVLDPNANLKEIIQNFNKQICAPMGLRFHPSLEVLRMWKHKWNHDILKRGDDPKGGLIERKEVAQFIKTQNEDRLLIAPPDGSLEAGVRTLGGELLNDAMQMLQDDRELGDIYDNETLIKRRGYIVNVFSHVTKMVQGKAALLLKASQEKRENAGFLMDILSKATSGSLTEEDMSLLKSAYTQQPNEQQVV